MSAALHGLIALGLLPADTVDPIPDSEVPADLVSPGILGFVVTAALAIVTILLILDMSRRVRRARYRGEVAELLEAERVEADRVEAERAASREQPPAD